MKKYLLSPTYQLRTTISDSFKNHFKPETRNKWNIWQKVQ